MDTELKSELYAIAIHGRTLSEITIDRLWCKDIRELIESKQPCPLSLELINELDQIAVDRMAEIRGNKLCMQVYGH